MRKKSFLSPHALRKRRAEPLPALSSPLPAHDDVVGDKEKDIRRQPRGGVGRADSRETPEADEDEGGEHSAAQLGYARKGGDGALADPLQGVAIDEHRAQKQIAGALPEQVLSAVGENIVVIQQRFPAALPIDKEIHERLVQARAQPEPQQRGKENVEHTHVHSLPHAVEFSRAAVLPRVVRHRRAERGESLADEIVDFGRGGVGGGDAAEGGVQPVERRLLYDTADRRNGKLQRHGQPDGDMPARKPQIEAEIRPSGTEPRVAPEHIKETGDGGEKVGKNGRERRADIVHLQPHDEREVQPHVERNADDKKDKRSGGVADRPQHRRKHVVKHRRADSAEDGKQIPVRIIEIDVGSLHQAEKCARERNRDGGEKGRDDNTERKTHGDRAADPLFVARAEALRNAHTEPRGKPVCKAEHEKRDGSRKSHARERVHVYGVADDHGIDHAVQLLKHASRKHGKRE